MIFYIIVLSPEFNIGTLFLVYCKALWYLMQERYKKYLHY